MIAHSGARIDHFTIYPIVTTCASSTIHQLEPPVNFLTNPDRHIFIIDNITNTLGQLSVLTFMLVQSHYDICYESIVFNFNNEKNEE